MKKMKIHILLAITLLCNEMAVYSMSNAVRSSILKANQAKLREARTKFTAAFIPASFWSKLSSYASQLWKVLAEPKTHLFRAAQMQKEAAKQTQQEIAKQDLDLDLEEKLADLKELVNSDS